MTEAVVTLQYN